MKRRSRRSSGGKPFIPWPARLALLVAGRLRRAAVDSGEFPLSYQISPGRVGWKLSELEEWISSRSNTPPRFGGLSGRMG